MIHLYTKLQTTLKFYFKIERKKEQDQKDFQSYAVVQGFFGEAVQCANVSNESFSDMPEMIIKVKEGVKN